MLSVVYLLVGAGLLIWGAERLVDGATILACVFKLPKSVVGLTLVALGTSAPELFVNVLAAADGSTEFALANVSGSNLANLCVGLGVCGLLGGITIRRADFGRDLIVFAAAPCLVLLILTLDGRAALPLWAIGPLTALMIYYGWSLMGRDADVVEEEFDSSSASSSHGVGRGVLFFLLGVVALYAGGEFTVRAAKSIAEYWNIDRAIIGLTIVAVLTSVPDIAATWVAARRGENEIAVGNIVGSNISNVVLVLNATVLTGGIFGATVIDIPQLASLLRLDYLIVTLLSLMALIIVLFSERLSRRTGVILLISYFVYLTFRVVTAVMGSGAVVALQS